MNHLTFGQSQASYPVAFLVPIIQRAPILDAYITPFALDPESVVVMDLHQSSEKKKTPTAEMKEYIELEVVPVLQDLKVQYVIVGDVEYFKVLTKQGKGEAMLGYLLDSPYGDFKVGYVPNYRAVFYDPPKIKAKIAQTMNAVKDHASDAYADPGTSIIKFAAYPKTDEEIAEWLAKLLLMDKPLAIDIEAFDLKHYNSGIGTITFCWSKTEGIAFPVDYVPIDSATEAPFGIQVRNEPRRKMLRAFFERFEERAMYHHISYDVYALIYQLFMKDLLDQEGLLHGLEVMLRNWDDTKLVTYLATNSCAGNKLGLKEQAQEYAGNYAVEEIKDIRNIPLDKLLQYNLVDGLSTHYTYEKWWDKLVADQQLDIYKTLFQPAIVDIIQMQLTGMPLNMKRVLEVEAELQVDFDKAISGMEATNVVQRFNYRRVEQHVDEMNATWKVKRTTVTEVLAQLPTNARLREKILFNPNSGPQLQDLLFEMLGLPILGRTKTGQAETGGDIIKDLRNHAADPDVLLFLNHLMDYASVNKILTSFIPAMKAAPMGPDGWHYLFGNFNLGGTVSGRLSSSDPNLQNLPANSKYAKKIKSCFQAPKGWLLCGLDFASLEDRISAVTTKDPNKLKVYTDGYDGHCLRTFAYFPDKMIGIVDTVASINTIAAKYPHERFLSKAPTFALTYQGTYITLMRNCGFSKEVAQEIEERYKKLYKVSIDWVQSKLTQASKDGYVTTAFGLRVRTPLLHQVIRGTRSTPHEAEAEGRTAGNALGQSWCLLNSRAWSEFMTKVRASSHRLDIRPCAQIHDAGYAMIRDEIEPIMYTNKHLVEAVEWQAHPEIAHPDVKLGGELSIFWPSWKEEIGIPNGATRDEVFHIIDTAMA